MAARRLNTCLACAPFLVASACLLAPTAPAASLERPSRDGYMFSYADLNGDGKLSPGEFGILLYPGMRKPDAPRQLSSRDEEKFKAADIDGNGSVDMAEFSLWLKQKN